MLFLLLGTHIYFTCRLRFIQKKIPHGIRLSLKPGHKTAQANKEGISPFAALSTALAATIGTGNIIGISTAIAVGGPGAVFWCWITGLLGIATCYAECYFSVKYRVKNPDGSYSGGPMYVMEHTLHQKSAAVLFAVSVVFVSFGMGSSVQSHSISAAITQQGEVSPNLTGIVTAVLAGAVILGGAKQISKICTWLVPFMSVFYLGGCFLIIWMNRDVFWETLKVIVCSAFTSYSVAGGILGTAVTTAMRTGISRGLFTNEAGLGSIPMAAAAAQTSSPQEQALVSMTGTFWDTVVMCAITGITVVGSMIKQPMKYAYVSADELCFAAFSQIRPAFLKDNRIPFISNLDGGTILSMALVLFAFATIIGWSYYGECAVRYLGNEKNLILYRLLYILSVYFGAILSLDAVWSLSDIFNSLMAVPNLICLWMAAGRENVIYNSSCKS